MVREHHMSILKQAKTNKQNLKFLCKKVTTVLLFFFWIPAITFWLASQTLVCSSQSVLKIADHLSPLIWNLPGSLLPLPTGGVQTWRHVGLHHPFAGPLFPSCPSYLPFPEGSYTFQLLRSHTLARPKPGRGAWGGGTTARITGRALGTHRWQDAAPC